MLCHFGSAGEHSVWTFPFYAITVTAVPVFMLTSFALAGNVFIDSDSTHLRKRIQRLLLPLVAWSAIYFCAYALIDLVVGTDRIHGIQDFIWQAVTGHRAVLNPTMWFHFDLIVLSCLAFACFRRAGDSKQIVLAVAGLMVIFGLVMQYSGWNYDLFGKLRYELKWPLGRLCETLPYAGLGLALACLLPAKNPDIAQGLPWNYSRLAVLGIGLVLLYVACFPWPRVEEGFHYGGFRIMWLSLAIYCVFNVLKVDFIPVCIIKLIVFLSRYTLGVYCILRVRIRCIVNALVNMSAS